MVALKLSEYESILAEARTLMQLQLEFIYSTDTVSHKVHIILSGLQERIVSDLVQDEEAVNTEHILPQ
jgi:hypothetical protein